jgi:hypothetical protein
VQNSRRPTAIFAVSAALFFAERPNCLTRVVVVGNRRPDGSIPPTVWCFRSSSMEAPWSSASAEWPRGRLDAPPVVLRMLIVKHLRASG